jgi:transposase
MLGAKPAIVELAMDKLEDILRRAEAKQFNDEDYAVVKTLFQSYVQLTALLKDKNVSLGRLRKMLFGASTEKTAAVIGREMDGKEPSGHADVPSQATEEPPGDDSSSSRKGHGRKGRPRGRST